jgi:hypothetical protein
MPNWSGTICHHSREQRVQYHQWLVSEELLTPVKFAATFSQSIVQPYRFTNPRWYVYSKVQTHLFPAKLVLLRDGG